ncbi:tetratricopeptide repeat protein [Marivirga sp. S37H4]|uniref:Tetratricopeptide repeat protein n=1 Tax=Marivirga aurantiaca TaxID=2802615 RepID=A0A934X0B7_9BACT|nr:tetratricopeptide repeat protein [Marivirga aurantiaca]MBK6266162.1 tetratricopeptide repeat protein [Marivirga aurantiaca]
MKIAFLLVLWMLLPSMGMADIGNIDSLKHELKMHPGLDSVRVDILNELSYVYWIIDPVEAENYSREALQLAISLNYNKGMAFANRSIGVSGWAQGNYEQGLNALMKALVLYQNMRDTLNIANVMMNTGLIYSEQVSYEEALAYYEEALKTFNLLNKQERAVNTLNHMGKLFQKQKKLTRAFDTYNMALNLSDKLNYSYGKATSYSNLASYFKDSNELDSALSYSHKALVIQSRDNDLNGKAFSIYTMGIIYFLKADYESAEKVLKIALEEAENISSKKLKRDIYLKLKEVAVRQGDLGKAITYFEQYSEAKDSLLNAEKLREFVRLENQFELEKSAQQMEMKEKELEILQQEAQLSRLWRQTLIIGILAVLIISYFIYSRQRMNIRRKSELLLKNKQIYETKETLAAVELENARLKEKELNQKIEFKNKELTSYTLNFVRKNELMEEIKSSIKELKKSKDSETVKKLNSLNRLVANSMHIDKDWLDFKRQFEEVHTDFFSQLKSNYPDITNNELKLCALLKLNMNLKEAANIMGISPESVKTARYRLRKKLHLSKEENLVEYIIKLERELIGE